MKRKVLKSLLSIFTVFMICCFVMVPSEAKVKISKKSATLYLDKTLQLKVSGTSKKVTWSSSKKSVATVTSKGLVTPHKKGTAYIYAKVKSKKYKCKVTVKQKVESITLNQSDLTMTVGDSKKLITATVGPSSASSKSLTWKSSNTSVVSLSKSTNYKYYITPKKAGTATITVSASDKQGTSASFTVTVENRKIDTGHAEYEVVPTYKITPSSKPYYSSFLKYGNYNDTYTKNYYTVRSYMELFEKNKGGVLEFTKGTYTITNTIYVPSNVTLIFDEGVIIKKGSKTGTSMSPSKSLFQLVEPSIGKKADADTITTKELKTYYNGVHDVKFVGEDATIDMVSHTNSSIGIVLGHNYNIDIAGITFKNMATDKHLIELNSSSDVNIIDCIFDAETQSLSGIKECINIDGDDAVTKGFNEDWASHDKTCCNNVNITYCSFENSRAGIGTHKVSADDDNNPIYHTNITVQNCRFTNCGTLTTSAGVGAALRMMNWEDAVVTDNTFIDCERDNIYATGLLNPIIQYNDFFDESGENMENAIRILKVHYAEDYDSESVTDLEGNENCIIEGNMINGHEVELWESSSYYYVYYEEEEPEEPEESEDDDDYEEEDA